MITLKHIIKTNDSDLINGINILYKYIPNNLSVNSNELVYWIDNYNKKFNDKMYCYVIKQDNTIIGWLQFTHFINNFIFIDYLIVEKKYRKSHIMKNIYSMINNEFEKLNCKSVILECGLEMNQHNAIIRLYKIFGFKQYDINYIEPNLNIDLYNKQIDWSEIPSILMYNDNKLDINNVLNIIYFNHYLRWYSFYEFDMSDYVTFLNKSIDKVLN